MRWSSNRICQSRSQRRGRSSSGYTLRHSTLCKHFPVLDVLLLTRSPCRTTRRGWKIMGSLPNAFSKRPHPAEHDLAGVIVDANGTSFSNGSEVIGFIPVCELHPFVLLPSVTTLITTRQLSSSAPVKAHSLNTSLSPLTTSYPNPPSSPGKKPPPSLSLH